MIFLIFILALLTGVALLRPRWALAAYLCMELLFPVFEIGSVTFRFSFVALPLLAVVVTFYPNALPVHRSVLVVISLVFIWLLWDLTVTLLQWPTFAPATPIYAHAYAVVRILLSLYIFSRIPYTPRELNRLLLILQIPMCLLALFSFLQVSGNVIVQELTLDHYTTANRVSVLKLTEETGIIARAVASFESPAYAAVYFLLAMSSTLFLLGEPTLKTVFRILLFGVLIIGFIGGLLTLSATFFAGIALMMALFIINLNFRRLAGSALAAVLVSLLAALGLEQLYSLHTRVEGSIAYQIRRLWNLDVFYTRYSEAEGSLSGVLAAFQDQPITGYGWFGPGDLFVGDSLYFVQLVSGGIVGLGLVVGIAVFLLKNLSCPQPSCFLGRVWLIIILAVGVGCPSFSLPRITELWVSIIALILSLERYDRHVTTSSASASDAECRRS